MSTLKKNTAKAIGTSFGFGFLPLAPGTFGTIFGILVYYALYFWQPELINWWLIGLSIVFTALGTWSCKVLEKDWGHDPSRVVMDESVGVWITMLFMPFNHWYVFFAFVLFRFFDILKPLGIRAIDGKMHSPFSVMLDDIVAGVYAWLVLQGIIFFFGGYF
ncbi:MAG: phosphatidylglycerophosphatase A [Polaribacter sp.]|jgi:phosphatidylglycerophosphatase A